MCKIFVWNDGTACLNKDEYFGNIRYGTNGTKGTLTNSVYSASGDYNTSIIGIDGYTSMVKASGSLNGNYILFNNYADEYVASNLVNTSMTVSGYKYLLIMTIGSGTLKFTW